MKLVVFGTLLAAASAIAIAQDRTEIRPMPRDELQALAGAYTLLRESLPEKPDDRALIVSAIRGMVQGADPESGEYYTPAENEKFTAPPLPDAGAMGLEFRTRKGRSVLVPLEDGPAAQAGIRFGDQLYAVDGTRTQDLEAHQVAQLLKGRQGTSATLTVFRESDLSVRAIPVQRRVFSLAGPKVSRPGPAVAMLRIPSFKESTLRDTAALLRDEWRRQPFKALILDLRNCPGGLVDASIGVASMFLPADTLVATFSGRTPRSQQVFRATQADYARGAGPDPLAELPSEIRTLPLAVLVDEATTAGAEIVAAALKDNKRATLYGRTSFGKGSIQTLTRLGDASAIKYTTAFWASPAGSRIHGAGVVPDMEVGGHNPDASVQAAVAGLIERKQQ